MHVSNVSQTGYGSGNSARAVTGTRFPPEYGRHCFGSFATAEAACQTYALVIAIAEPQAKAT